MKSADGAAGTVSVCAIAVTYRPDPAALRALVASVAPQVAALVIVANDGAANDGAANDGDVAAAGLAQEHPAVQVLAQPVNVGLAAAQNIGIAWARANDHTHVLLLDQDSAAGDGMVAALVEAHAELTRSGHRVAAVGPRFRDARDQRDAPFVRVAFPMSEKVWCGGEPYVRTDFLIGSGSLIPLAVLDDIGALDADLFIDNVDMEWSFRGRARGYELFGVCAAQLEHRLGDARQPVLFGRLTVVTHSPIRLYYIMRNRVLLYRTPSTPRVWIAQDVIRVPVKFLLFAVLIGPRGRNTAMMLRGLADGVRGRRGQWGHARVLVSAWDRSDR
jgi:rhamnosyltransferase